MRLISHTGHSEFFLEFHKNLKVGDCLCGLAAKTGEVIVSKKSTYDTRHTINYEGMTPHGYIIMPLKARGSVVGVIYLFMPVDFEIGERRLSLLKSIGNQVGVAIDNSRLYEETKKSALHDPLTGIANRRMMNMIFKRTFEEVKRYKRPLSIIMLDIDHFKKYNDTKGHIAGDKALVAVSKVLINATRGVDLVSRYGGEEFLLLLPETDTVGAKILAERIRESIEKETDVTASLGVAICSEEVNDEEEFINKADSALYEAKNSGRNRVEINE
jgi:diguanylate cyclase (GGDEF)-like protein